ncbi:MAG: DUF11 domain-containing protein [Anaerolineae bacterium]|nr:DUF11 domain-containing protein [Anaerolineae bacterium]
MHLKSSFWFLLRFAVVAAFLAGVVPVIDTPPAAQAQGPFRCGATLYIMQNEPAQLYTINRATSPYALTPIGPATTIYNAIGYNPQDDYLYGFANNTGIAYRIDSAGGVTSLGAVASLVGTNEWWSGTFLENGTYIIANNQRIVRLDVTTAPPTVLSDNPLSPAGTYFYDIAVSPVNGLIYGYNEVTDRMATVDPFTGVVTDFGNVQPNYSPASTFFDVFGTLYAYSTPAGGGVRDRFFTVNLTTGDFTQVSTGPAVTFSDGASCPFGVGITKEVSPSPAFAGSVVTYTYRISNQGESAVPADLTDTMDSGRTFIPGTLSNPFGGAASFSGGNATMTIAGMTLPANSMNTITINVQTAAGVTGTVYNQATISNLPTRLDQPAVSDYPPTPGFPDHTPLELITDPNPPPPPPPPTDTPGTGEIIILVDPHITKAVDLASARIGDQVTFFIEVYNNGTLPVDGVVVSDPIPAILDILNVTTTRGTVNIVGNTVEVSIGTLNPGDRVSIVITTRVNQSAVAGDTARNTAYLSDAGGGIWPSNTTDTLIELGVGELPETGKAENK